MDRMKDSGSFDAGSTPAGRTEINTQESVPTRVGEVSGSPPTIKTTAGRKSCRGVLIIDD